MRIAILGSAGQLGRDLCPRLPGQILSLTRADADLTDGPAMRACLESLRPNVVVNCAAYNLVDRAESEPEAAFAVNVWAVRHLAQTCRDLGVLLVHFSTDYVFGLDAARRSPWQETDTPGPVSVYGLSKLSGEYLVRTICPQHLVLRTCGLYGVSGSGGKGGNFVETMIRLAAQGKPLRVVHDQRCTPSYTVDIAQATAELLEQQARGLFHVTNSGDASWYEFAQTIFELTKLRPDLTPISSVEFNAAARRPVYSVLKSSSVHPLRSWREALSAYLTEREKLKKVPPVNASAS